MKERGIIFSGPMVKALLAGTKTQTRRVIKPQPPAKMSPDEPAFFCPPIAPEVNDMFFWCTELSAPLDQGGRRHWWPDYEVGKRCPYGRIGDRLWVRETWKPTSVCINEWTGVHYRADDEHIDRPYFHTPLARNGWRSSIHMPRLAARIMLELTNVRAERLQDITAIDAGDEGAYEWANEHVDRLLGPCEKWNNVVQAYRALWEDINGVGSWDFNPWVWVLEFKRVGTA